MFYMLYEAVDAWGAGKHWRTRKDPAEALLGYEKRPYQTENDYILYEQALAVQKQVNKTVVRDKTIVGRE